MSVELTIETVTETVVLEVQDHVPAIVTIDTIPDLREELDDKVDKVAGMGLSELSFTTADKNSLYQSEQDRHTHANKSVIDDLSDNAGALEYRGLPVSDQAALDSKVDKVAGYSLVADDEIAKLLTVEQDAQKNTVSSVAGKQGDVLLAKSDVGLGLVDNTSDADKPVSTAVAAALAGKVDAEAGKQLSDENYTLAEKDKLAGIADGATANRSDSENADKEHTHQASDITELGRAQFADVFNYVGRLTSTNNYNTTLKEGTYLTLSAPLNSPEGVPPNVLVTIQNVDQRYIQTLYNFDDSRRKWQRVVRFNNDGVFLSAETWRDLNQVVRSGLADSFLYAGVLTSGDDLNSIVKDGVYLTTSVPVNAPVGAPNVSFIDVSRAGAFVRQTLTGGSNALNSWSRNFQLITPINGGVWVSSNPADNLASPVKAGAVKVGTGLEIKPDGTLNVIAPSQDNPFAGKKIVCFGDSITEFKTYPQQLGLILGAEGINVGFGGCMMAAHWDVGYKEMCMYRLADYIASGDYSGLIAAAQDVYDRTGDDNRAIASRLAAIDWNTVDYITILYGSNDYANAISVGAATDIVSDGSSYLGSANYAIQQLQTTYPHLKIAMITPIYRARGANGGTDSDDSPNAPTDGKYLRDFANGLVEAAKINHIPCFNLHDDSGINKYTASLYLNPAPDGVHLTEVGATFLAQKLAAKMRANF